MNTESKLTLSLDSVSLWSGDYAGLKVGMVLAPSVAFAMRSNSRSISTDTPVGLEPIGEERYAATARVIDNGEVVVLDLGPLLAIRPVPPGYPRGDLAIGEVIEVELALSFNTMPGSDWIQRARERHAIDTPLRVTRIRRVSPDPGASVDIAVADRSTVGAYDYCLVDCTLQRATD